MESVVSTLLPFLEIDQLFIPNSCSMLSFVGISLKALDCPKCGTVERYMQILF